MKNVLIIATNQSKLGDSERKTGVCLSELAHSYYTLYEEGCIITIASPKGGYIPLAPQSEVEDSSVPLNKRYKQDKQILEMMEHSIPLSEIKSREYDCIFIPGGHGALFDLPNNYDVKRVIKENYENGGIVSAISHGVCALTEVKLSSGNYLVENKHMTSITNTEEESTDSHTLLPFLVESRLLDHKAKYHKVSQWQECVMADKRLITAQNPESCVKFNEILCRSLELEKVLA